MHKKAKNICENLLSFPTWERELKLDDLHIDTIIGRSFPTWERELKYPMEMLQDIRKWSFPTWERELKCEANLFKRILRGVVPHVGT